VDGDEDSRFMLIMLLGLAMIEATAAGDAAEALSLMQAERFDLCLLDAWLPKIDGFELRMRKDFYMCVSPQTNAFRWFILAVPGNSL
jgi:DNA-binding response OmpR family regulator